MADSKPIALITGIAGFIGYHTAKRFAAAGYLVYGVDNLSEYYSIQLKTDRLSDLGISTGFDSETWVSNNDGSINYKYHDLSDKEGTVSLFQELKPQVLIHLAAQPGVRMSITHPDVYMTANITATFNILEGLRAHPSTAALLASSSSVYGLGKEIPYHENQPTNEPVSLYAATKKSTEVIAHYYANQFNLNVLMLRFFTVYGPWGRPDMAVYKFFDRVLNNEQIDIYNYGKLRRDFTYVDDIVESIRNLAIKVTDGTISDNYSIVNIGNQEPVELLDFVHLIEEVTGVEAKKQLLPMQPGDVFETYADTTKLDQLTGKTFNTPLKDGLKQFYYWYQAYHIKSEQHEA